jgi:hypothetical protein
MINGAGKYSVKTGAREVTICVEATVDSTAAS